MRAGTYARLPSLPFVLGTDGSGVVEAVVPSKVRQCLRDLQLFYRGFILIISPATRPRCHDTSPLKQQILTCTLTVPASACCSQDQGAAATKFAVGDRVYLSGSLSGTYAQFCLCSLDQLQPLPPGLNFSQGAAIGIAYRTAYRALFQASSGAIGRQ